MNIILYILLAIFWGGSFLAIQNIISILPPLTSAFYRVFFSLIFIAIYIHFQKNKNLKNLDKREILFSSMTGVFAIGLPFALLFSGEKFISPSLAALINGTVPLWTLLLSILFFNGRKQINLKKLIGIALGLIGIIIIFYPNISLSGRRDELIGLALVVGMAWSYALGINLNNNFLSNNKTVTGITNLFFQQISSGVFLIIVVALFEGIKVSEELMSTKSIISLFYLSFFSTFLAFIIFYYLIKNIGAIKASTVTYFVPAIAIILDYFINGRLLQMNEIIGALTIFTSMYFLR